MRLLLTLFFIILMFQSFSFSQEWTIKNKWKISCGLVNKEALVINGKPKKTYSKNEFKVDTNQRYYPKPKPMDFRYHLAEPVVHFQAPCHEASSMP